ncbi:hypothetical protein BTW08_15145 [Salinicola sp. MH3R3-1]|uniref:hypothetical protein n=1 Tax=Salinicola sp. MH3R3-1 TaxID=1928762 RepID=UPI00094E09C7|nr:hypothetical protein [Salinicola sp. MH3R3-1]OLO06833.1 hypothetical protein BTW08_15145 [Salinicola sp. MH3R3-1]
MTANPSLFDGFEREIGIVALPDKIWGVSGFVVDPHAESVEAVKRAGIGAPPGPWSVSGMLHVQAHGAGLRTALSAVGRNSMTDAGQFSDRTGLRAKRDIATYISIHICWRYLT